MAGERAAGTAGRVASGVAGAALAVRVAEAAKAEAMAGLGEWAAWVVGGWERAVWGVEVALGAGWGVWAGRVGA